LPRLLWVGHVLYESDYQPLSDIRKGQVHWPYQHIVLASITDALEHSAVYTRCVQLNPLVKFTLVSTTFTYLSLYASATVGVHSISVRSRPPSFGTLCLGFSSFVPSLHSSLVLVLCTCVSPCSNAEKPPPHPILSNNCISR